MSKPEKLSAERLAEIRALPFFTDIKWSAVFYVKATTDLLAHCDALAADNQVLRDLLAKIELAPNYVSLGEVQDWARTALEKTK